MKQNRIGITLLQFLMSILLVFSVLCGWIGLLGAGILSSPRLLLSQLERQQAAEKAYTQLESYFEEQAQATAVPAEVFLECLDEEFLQEAMEAKIYDTYSQFQGKSYASSETDYSSLEQAVTTYFEAYAEENGYEKDDSYTQKLNEVTQDAEEEISSVVDVYHLNALQKIGLIGKLSKLTTLLTAVGIGGCILAALLLLGLILLRNRALYWIGAACFADGLLLGLPAVFVLGSGIISHFSLQDAAVYAVFTGTMTELTQIMLGTGSLLLVVGMLFLWIAIRRSRRPQLEKTEASKEYEGDAAQS